MTHPELFDPGPPDPGDDAAPLAGGAGVEGIKLSPDSIARLASLMPPARRNAPKGTSHVAASRIAGHTGSLRSLILLHLTTCGEHGATDDEGEVALDIRPQTYTPRRGELVRLGLVVDSGRRRLTLTRRPAAVWVTPDHAPKTEGGTA